MLPPFYDILQSDTGSLLFVGALYLIIGATIFAARTIANHYWR